MVSPQPAPQQPGFNPNLLQPGDAQIFNSGVLNAAARDGRRGTRKRPEASSVYTQVAEEVTAFAVEMRDEFKVVAPIMKQKLTRAQARTKMQNMSPEERQVLVNKMGVRNFVHFAKSLEPRGSK